MAAVLGAVSGLYDKYLMAPADQGGIGLDRMIVQSWYNIYQIVYDGRYLNIVMVAEAQIYHSVSLALVYYSDIYFSVGS